MYRVQDLETKDYRALKVVCLPQGSAPTPVARRKMMREWVALEQLQGNEHVVGIHHVCVEDTRISMVMALSNGGDLFDYIMSQPNHRIPEERVRIIFGQLIKAILYCHQRGFVHRDVKVRTQ